MLLYIDNIDANADTVAMTVGFTVIFSIKTVNSQTVHNRCGRYKIDAVIKPVSPPFQIN